MYDTKEIIKNLIKTNSKIPSALVIGASNTTEKYTIKYISITNFIINFVEFNHYDKLSYKSVQKLVTKICLVCSCYPVKSMPMMMKEVYLIIYQVREAHKVV